MDHKKKWYYLRISVSAKDFHNYMKQNEKKFQNFMKQTRSSYIQWNLDSGRPNVLWQSQLLFNTSILAFVKSGKNEKFF